MIHSSENGERARRWILGQLYLRAHFCRPSERPPAPRTPVRTGGGAHSSGKCREVATKHAPPFEPPFGRRRHLGVVVVGVDVQDDISIERKEGEQHVARVNLIYFKFFVAWRATDNDAVVWFYGRLFHALKPNRSSGLRRPPAGTLGRQQTKFLIPNISKIRIIFSFPALALDLVI